MPFSSLSLQESAVVIPQTWRPQEGVENPDTLASLQLRDDPRQDVRHQETQQRNPGADATEPRSNGAGGFTAVTPR